MKTNIPAPTIAINAAAIHRHKFFATAHWPVLQLASYKVTLLDEISFSALIFGSQLTLIF